MSSSLLTSSKISILLAKLFFLTKYNKFCFSLPEPIITSLVLIFVHDSINKSKPFTFSNLPTARAYLLFCFVDFFSLGFHQFDIPNVLFLISSIALLDTPMTRSHFSYTFLFFLIP